MVPGTTGRILLDGELVAEISGCDESCLRREYRDIYLITRRHKILNSKGIVESPKH